MLNDSWEMVAHVDPTNNLSPLAPARAVMNDIFSLAVCMGGLMLLVFSDLREERQAALIEGFQANDDWREKRRLMTTGQWLLAGVAYDTTQTPSSIFPPLVLAKTSLQDMAVYFCDMERLQLFPATT